MTNVNTTSSVMTSSSEGSVVAETVLLCTIIAVSLLGNLSLWIVVLRSRSLRTITNMFLLGLSAADLFVATFNMPVTVYVIIKGSWDLSDTACIVTGYTNMLTLCTSVLSLCNISINRYIMVVRPGKFRDIYTKRKAISMMTAVVLLAAFISALPLMGWCEYKFIPTHSFCFADWANHMSYAFFMIGCCFCIPFFVMTVCNIFIFRAVRSSRKKVKSVILPASIQDSPFPSEISKIPDVPEVNCSSTDVDHVHPPDTGLDKIKIDRERFPGPRHVDVGLHDDECNTDDIPDSYNLSENNSMVLTDTSLVNSNESFEKEEKPDKPSIKTPPKIALDLSSTPTHDVDEGDHPVDEDCQSTTSSCTETSCLRAYNPAFDRGERARGRPVSRGQRQHYLTIPRGENKYIPENKQLRKTGLSISDSSLHSSDSEGSLKLTPIQIQLQDESNSVLQEVDNNNVANSKPGTSEDINDSQGDKGPNKTHLTGILTNNNPSQRTPELRRKTLNGHNRSVSLNTDRNTTVEHRSAVPDSASKATLTNRTSTYSTRTLTNRTSTYSTRSHGSPPPRRREEIVLARSLAVVVVLFVICWLPYCICMLLSIFYEGTVPRGFHMFTLLIGYANSGCNPIVYGVMNKRFAVGYRNLFCFWREEHRLSFNSSSF